jgi:hypothetical protein
MSDQTDTLGGRLPLTDPAALNPAQREIFDRMATRIVPWANDAQFCSSRLTPWSSSMKPPWSAPAISASS